MEIRSKFQPTIVYVTHDEREALELADKIAILNDGQILQYGTPSEISGKPTSRKVAEIIGGWNIIKVSCTKMGPRLKLTSKIFDFELEYSEPIHTNEGTIELEIGIPTSAIGIRSQPGASKDDFVTLSGLFERATPWYGQHIVHVSCGSYTLRVEAEILPKGIQVGSQVFVRLKKSCIRVWPRR